MAKRPLSDYSVEELDAQLRKIKSMFGVFLGLIIVMVIISLLTIYENEISFNTFLPIFFVPMLFVYSNQLKSIKKEIASRK